MGLELAKFKARIWKFIRIFILQRFQLWIVKFSTRHIYGPQKIEYNLDELIVLCLVRDGQLYIKSFIEHYLALGVKHIVFLDNNSTDNTVLIAQQYKNVTVLQSKLAYKNYKNVLKQYLIRRFGKNRWSLCVDIDEFFDYPFSNAISLKSFLEYLNQKSFTAVVAHMLEMFSDKPVLSQKSRGSDNLKEKFRYYDVSDIIKVDYRTNFFRQNIISNNEIKEYYGGIRKIVFVIDEDLGPRSLKLTKHPLIFLDKKIKIMEVNDHDVRKAHLADFSCVLFHYKFLSNFYEHSRRLAYEESYFNKSVEYKIYSKTLEQNPNLQIKQKSSKQIRNVNDLIVEKFLVISEEYINWIKAHAKELSNMKTCCY